MYAADFKRKRSLEGAEGLQNILQSNSNKNSMVLAQKQT
jgi:hypothetical protein